MFGKQKIFCALIYFLFLSLIGQSGTELSNKIANSQCLAPNAKNESPYSWPLPSYTQAQQLISNGNPEKAIKLLEKEMTGLFPFRFPATNGYEIYFYYYKLLGDAYSAADNPVKAIDVYRLALSPVPYATITNSPIPYAKCLQSLALQFQKIGRLIDAESLLLSADKLIDDDKIKSNIHFIRCLEAARILDFQTAAKEAGKCIEINPDYNSKAFHYIALKQFSEQNYKSAIDTWLTGLCGIPVDQLDNYLDISQMFWRQISEQQIFELYDIFTSLLTYTPLKYADEIERILKERIKLQKIYPEYFEGDNPADLIDKNIRLANLFREINLESQGKIDVKTNINFNLDYSLLKTNFYEHQINLFLYNISDKIKHKTTTYDRYIKSKRIIDKLLENNFLSTNTTITIDGWNIWFKINYLRAITEDKRTCSTDESRIVARKCMSKCFKMISENKAGNGDPRDLIFLYLEKLKKSLLQQKKKEATELLDDIKSIVNNSEIIPKTELAVNLIGKTNVMYVLQMYEKLINLPSAYPASEFWKKLSDAYFQLADMETNVGKKEVYFNKAINYLFDGLEKAVVSYADSEERYTSERQGLKPDPVFSKIDELEKAEKLDKKNYEKLKQFSNRYGVCIPAKDSQTDLIKEIIYRKNELNNERESEVELEIICDASPWLKKEQVWLWADILNEPVLMKQLDSSNFVATIIVPKDVFLVNIMFCKSREKIPEKPSVYLCEKIKIPFNAKNKIRINKKTNRDFQSTIIVECNAQKLSNVKKVFIIGNIKELGNYKKTILMSDDGKTYNDKKANDKIFIYSFNISPEVRKLKYLFLTNESGEWGQGTPIHFRTYITKETSTITNIIKHEYGKKIR